MKTLFLFGLLSFAAGSISAAAPANGSSEKTYFIDVHEFGPGKVTPEAVAEAHRADLAVQAKYGVRFRQYWIDENHGRVYCLAEAKSAPSIADAHREAHGLVPDRILPVATTHAMRLPPSDTLFLDIHKLGNHEATPEHVLTAHASGLGTERRSGLRFLNYSVDDAHGQVMCLWQASTAEAVLNTHVQHPLLPDFLVKLATAP